MNSASEHVYANAFAAIFKKQMFQDGFLKLIYYLNERPNGLA
jgi:hypothetical protein